MKYKQQQQGFTTLPKPKPKPTILPNPPLADRQAGSQPPRAAPKIVHGQASQPPNQAPPRTSIWQPSFDIPEKLELDVRGDGQHALL
jgi:hypothetical protein